MGNLKEQDQIKEGIQNSEDNQELKIKNVVKEPRLSLKMFSQYIGGTDAR